MVAGLVGPVAKEVVGHEVDGVEILGRLAQVDVLEDRLSGGEGSSEKVPVFGKVDTDGRNEREEVAALLWSARVLPNNYERGASDLHRSKREWDWGSGRGRD
jgi:hypothetical protein